MAKKQAWQDWGFRFRLELRARDIRVSQLAERIGLAASTVRGWINGSREINLSDFFRLCSAAGIDPAAVLFTKDDALFMTVSRAWARSDDRGRELLLVAAEAAERMSETSEGGIRAVPPRR